MNWPWLTFGTWLLHSAVGGGLLLLLGWTVLRWCRQPARQQYVGESTVLAALLLAVLAVGPPWLIIPVLPLEPTAPDEPTASLSLAPPKREQHDLLPLQGRERARRDSSSFESSLAPENGLLALVLGPALPRPTSDFDATQADVPGLAASPASKAVPESEPEPLRPSEAAGSAAAFSPGTIVPWCGAAYAFASTVLLGRWLLGYLALWRLFRSARPAPESVAGLFATMVHGQRVPRLLVSDRLRVPLSCGLLRPTVVVPAALCEPAATPALRWVFAHELTHLQRRDAWACVLFGLGQAVYFYVPWFWWLRRQVRLCQEYIADAAAAEQTSDAVDYAQFLLSLTAAPAVPQGATGVSGNSSDLFRRVTMLLQSSLRMENRCPRWWSLMAVSGLLTLAVVVSGIGLRADAAPTPPFEEAEFPVVDKLPVPVLATLVGEEPKPEPQDARKKDKPSKEDKPKKKTGTLEIPLPDIDDLLKKLPAGMDPKQLEQARAQMLKAREEIRKAMEQLQKQTKDIDEEIRKATRAATEAARQAARQPLTGRTVTSVTTGQGRLGILVEKPSDAMADQLDLPKGQGLLIQQVQPNTPAAKAGLKANDILLELDGKSVSSDPGKFLQSLEEIKSGKAVSAVVLRKGKRQTIRGIELAEGGKPQTFTFRPGQPGVGGVLQPGQWPKVQFENFSQLQGFAVGRTGVMTTTFRTDDHFTSRHQEGSLIITVTGNVSDGKAKVNEISVQDGKESHKYKGLNQVPEQYRDKVRNLIELNEKSNVKIEIRTRPQRQPTREKEEDKAPQRKKTVLD